MSRGPGWAQDQEEDPKPGEKWQWNYRRSEQHKTVKCGEEKGRGYIRNWMMTSGG